MSQVTSSLSVDTGDITVYVSGTGAPHQTHTTGTGYTEGTQQDRERHAANSDCGSWSIKQ